MPLRHRHLMNGRNYSEWAFRNVPSEMTMYSSLFYWLKERTTPDFAPKPEIRIVFSCARTPVAANASATARAIFFT